MDTEELVEYIENTIEEVDDYESAADALWRCSYKAFEYTADRVGATGFQTGYASLKLVEKIRMMEGPFSLKSARKLLYPQYSPVEDLLEFFLAEDTRDYLKEEAEDGLDRDLSENVRERMEKICRAEDREEFGRAIWPDHADKYLDVVGDPT